MNYKTASDFELNKRLAELLGYKIVSDTPVNCVGVRCNDSVTKAYCNSLAAMEPVIESLWEDLMRTDDTGSDSIWNSTVSRMECSLLRAAVIVAIQVLEKKESQHAHVNS
jgi:hypothetical protein